MASMWSRVSIERIEGAFHQIPEERVFLGIDGIVDRVYQIVKERREMDSSLYHYLQEFGQELVDRGEGGLSCEVVKRRSSLGGFTANTGYALGKLGIGTTLLGMYGRENLDPHFQSLEKICHLISIGEPGVAMVFEFNDGKLLLPHLENHLRLTWDELVDNVHFPIEDLFTDTSLASLGYWSNLLFFDDLLNHLKVYFKDQVSSLFFDLGNIRKRSLKDLKKTLDLFKGLEREYSITLSLNLHEAQALLEAMGEDPSYREEVFSALIGPLGLSCVVVHAPSFGTLYSQEDTLHLEQEICQHPAKTTGAGDTFNAGLIAGEVLGLNPLDRLALSVAMAGVYVKEGEILDREEVFHALRWLKRLFG